MDSRLATLDDDNDDDDESDAAVATVSSEFARGAMDDDDGGASISISVSIDDPMSLILLINNSALALMDAEEFNTAGELDSIAFNTVLDLSDCA